MPAEGGRRRPRTAAVVAVLLAAAAALAGCATVPTSGPVMREEVSAGRGEGPYVGLLAEAPRPGEDELAIVEGFLAAMASYEPGQATARLYLTPEARAGWRPAGVDVHEGTTVALRLAAAGRVTASVPLAARLDAASTWSNASGQALALDLVLEQVDGQWRIANPPPRLVVSAFDFEREFRAYQLYFLDPAYDVVVPDEVFLPIRGSVSTLLVQALLRGPSPWLAPAVRSAFPEHTTLGIASVPVEGGTARVELSEAASATGPRDRERMAAQLAWTLRQVPGVLRVALTVGSVPLVLPGPQTGARGVDAFARYDPVGRGAGALYAVADGRVVTALDGDPQPVGGPFGAEGAAYRSVAVARGAARAAAVSASGSRIDVAGFGEEDEVVARLEGADLAAPSFDRLGVLWTVDPRRSAVVAVAADGRWAQVPVEAALAMSPRAIRLAPDGARAVLLLDGPGGPAVAVAVVLRGTDGSEASGLRLAAPQVVPLPGGVPVAAGWFAASRLAVLLQPPGADPEPFTVGLRGNQPEGRGAVAGAETLAAAPGEPLVVGIGDGRLLRQGALMVWEPAGLGSHPAYPG